MDKITINHHDEILLGGVVIGHVFIGNSLKGQMHFKHSAYHHLQITSGLLDEIAKAMAVHFNETEHDPKQNGIIVCDECGRHYVQSDSDAMRKDCFCCAACENGY